MNNAINVSVGIYNTAYKLINHRDGTITLKSPYIKWINNTGNLDFVKYKIESPSLVTSIKNAFSKNSYEHLANIMENSNIIESLNY